MKELELSEAFEALVRGESGAVAAEAGVAIRRCALIAARRDGRLQNADREDCAQEVFFKLFKRLSTGEHPVRNRSSAGCAAYVREMVRNWATDRGAARRRRHDRHLRLVREGPDERRSFEVEVIEAEEAEASRERVREVRAVLETVAEAAIDRRQPRHRPHLERGWREIRAMVFEGKALRALLEDDGEWPPDADEATARSARNAAYKRHERTRLALESTAEALRDEGELSAEEHALTSLAIPRLVRRRRGAGGDA